MGRKSVADFFCFEVRDDHFLSTFCFSSSGHRMNPYLHHRGHESDTNASDCVSKSGTFLSLHPYIGTFYVSEGIRLKLSCENPQPNRLCTFMSSFMYVLSCTFKLSCDNSFRASIGIRRPAFADFQKGKHLPNAARQKDCFFLTFFLVKGTNKSKVSLNCYPLLFDIAILNYNCHESQYVPYFQLTC